MLTGLGFPAPTFFAWVLILSEIVFGIALLANWKLKYMVVPPMIILAVAAFTVYWKQWPSMLLHFVIISNYWILALVADE